MSRRSWWGAVSRLLLDNFLLKLISVLFALGFYAVIHSEQNAQRTIAVKLVVEKPPENASRALMSPLPPTVNVTVVGPLKQLEAIHPETLSITLNLEAAQSIPDLKLLSDMITELPPRVKVRRIEPAHLAIRFEEIIERKVKVQVTRTGEPREGMEVVGEIATEPATVVAIGTESAVSVIQFARSEPYDLSGLDEGEQTRLLKLAEPPEHVSFGAGSVLATVKVARKLASRAFTELRIEVVGVAAAQVRPTTVEVRVQGAPERVNELRAEAIVPRVDPKAMGEDISKPGSANLPVIVDIPNVGLSISPPYVFVRW